MFDSVLNMSLPQEVICTVTLCYVLHPNKDVRELSNILDQTLSEFWHIQQYVLAYSIIQGY